AGLRRKLISFFQIDSFDANGDEARRPSTGTSSVGADGARGATATGASSGAGASANSTAGAAGAGTSTTGAGGSGAGAGISCATGSATALSFFRPPISFFQIDCFFSGFASGAAGGATAPLGA